MGRGEKVARGEEILQMDMMKRLGGHGMPGWNEVTGFSHFVYPCNAGYPS